MERWRRIHGQGLQHLLGPETVLDDEDVVGPDRQGAENEVSLGIGCGPTFDTELDVARHHPGPGDGLPVLGLDDSGDVEVNFLGSNGKAHRWQTAKQDSASHRFC